MGISGIITQFMGYIYQFNSLSIMSIQVLDRSEIKFLKTITQKGTVMAVEKKDKDDPDYCAKRYMLPNYEYLIEGTRQINRQLVAVPQLILPSKLVVDEDQQMLYLVMERGKCSCGDIITEMRRTNKYVSYADFKSVFVNVSGILQKLHMRHQSHGHIKPNNVIYMGGSNYALSDPAEYSIDGLDHEYDQFREKNEVQPQPADVYRFGITMFELATLRSPLEFKVFRDEKLTKTKVAQNFKEEIKKRYGSKIEKVLGMMVEPNQETRITMDEIQTKYLKEIMDQESAQEVEVEQKDRQIHVILDEITRLVRDREQNLESFFEHYEMNFYKINEHAFFQALEDLGIIIKSNERYLIKKSLDVNNTGEFNLTNIIKGGSKFRMRELNAQAEKSLRELLKEIFSFCKEKGVNIRQQLIKRDQKRQDWLDVVTFGEVMAENKMELANEDVKIVCDKYDPEDKGRIYYHYFCDDIEDSVTAKETDLAMLILEMYQIIRVKFTKIENFFKKYDTSSKGHITLTDLSRFLRDYNISPASTVLQQLYSQIDPENRNIAVYLRLKKIFQPLIDKDLTLFLTQLTSGLYKQGLSFSQYIEAIQQPVIDIEKLYEAFVKLEIELKRPDLTFFLAILKVEKNAQNQIDIHDLRQECYRNAERLHVINSFTLKGVTHQEPVVKAGDDTFKNLMEKLKYKLKQFSTSEMVSLFDISAKKDNFMNFDRFSQLIDEVDGSIQGLEKQLLYKRFDPNQEDKVSAKEFLSQMGVHWDQEVSKTDKRVQLAELDQQIKGFDVERFQPMKQMIIQIATEIQKLDLVPGQYFRGSKKNKMDQTDLRYSLKQLNVFLGDYGDHYEQFCKLVAYPSDLNQVDLEKLIAVVEHFSKINKIEKMNFHQENLSPLRVVVTWFENIVSEMINQKLDFYIFQDFDHYNYGFIRRQDLDQILFTELNLEDDGTFSFFVNYVKDDRSGDISLRKLKEGIEKERDARILYEDLIDLIKEQRLDLDRIFRNYDFNQSQSMDVGEFGRLIKTLQPTVQAPVVEVLFVKFDVNNDRSISLKEFRGKIFGEQAFSQKEHKTIIYKHFIEDVDELLYNAKTDFESVFKPYERQGVINLEDFREALKILGMNLQEEQSRLRIMIDFLAVHGKTSRLNFPQLKELYMRYRKSGEGEMVFSKEDLRRVESFANTIEKKLIRVKKSFQEVFTDRLKNIDGSFKFEDVKHLIQFSLQLEENVDQRLFLRYIQNTGGQNMVDINQLERLVIAKKDISKELFLQVVEFLANSTEIIREFEIIDFEQTGLINPLDLKRVIRKLKGPILEPEEIRLFGDKLGVMKANHLQYRTMLVEARKKFESSGLVGSNLQRVCERLKQELVYRGVDLVDLMKLYDKGNGRVRITAVLQELKEKNIEITDGEQKMIFQVVRPDDSKQVDIYDLQRLIQKGSLELDREEMDKGYTNKRLVKFEDEQGQTKIKGKNIQQLIKRIQTSAQSLMEEQGYNIRTLFRRLDRDVDEYLSIREFKNAVIKLFGITAPEEEIERVFEEFDTDRTYKMGLDEFEIAIYGEKKEEDQIKTLLKKIKRTLLEQSQASDPTQQLLEIFNSIDSNNDGVITYPEFQSTMRQLYPSIKQSEIELVFKYFDKQNENKLSYDYFISVIREDHLNLDKLKENIEKYLAKHSMNLDSFYQQFANQRGQLLVRDLGRMTTAIGFLLDDSQLDELFEFLDTQKDNALTKAEFRAIIFNKSVDVNPIFKKLRRLCLKQNVDLEYEMKKKDERLSGQISYFSYSRVMKAFATQLHPFEIELLFKTFDPKNTKLMNYKEFMDRVQEINIDIKPIIEEIQKTMENYRINEEKLFKSFDRNNNGQLSMEEFDIMLQSLRIFLPDEENMECFQAFDTDDTGSITLYEFISVLKQEKISKQANIHLILANKSYNRKELEKKSISEQFFTQKKQAQLLIQQMQQAQTSQQDEFDPNHYEQLIRKTCIARNLDLFELFGEYDKTDWQFKLESINDLKNVFVALEITIPQIHIQQYYYYHSSNQPELHYIPICLRIQKASSIFVKALLRVMKKCKYSLDSLFNSIAKSKSFWSVQEFLDVNEKLKLGITPNEMKTIFEGWDLSKKGKLNKDQVAQCLGVKDTQQEEIYMDVISHLSDIVNKRQLFYLYQKQDILNNNFITFKDFVKVTTQLIPDLAEEEVEAMKVKLEETGSVNLRVLQQELGFKEQKKDQKSVGFDLKKQGGGQKKKQQISQNTMDGYVQTIKSFVTKRKKNMGDLKNYYFGNKHQIDERAFIQLTVKLNCGLKENQARELFYFLDSNGTGFVSINEFVLTFIPDGKISQLDQSKLVNTLDQEIKELFDSVDENKNGSLDSAELHNALVSIGINPGNEELQYYFNLFDKDKDDKISIEEFSSILKDFIRKELSQANDFLGDLRKEFKAADTTNQRSLRQNQISGVFRNLGIQIPEEDIETLFREIDEDNSGTVDIDEFIYFMSKNQSGMSSKAAQVVMNIKGTTRISLQDLKAIFDAFPANFTKSFCKAQSNANLNLSSTLFRPQIDSTGLFYADLLYLRTFEVNPPQSVLEKSVPAPKMLVEIHLQVAEGVPIPDQKDIPKEAFLHREIGLVLHDRVRNAYVGNTVYLDCSWSEEYEDRWVIEKNVVFKHAQFDDKKDQNLDLVVEMIAHIRKAGKLVEMSCCYGEIPMVNLFRTQGKASAELKGGGPNKVLSIDKKDVRTNRTGWRSMIKALAGDVQSQLKYESRTIVNPPVVKDMAVLPDRCLLDRAAVNYVRSFREYFAYKAIYKEGELDTRLHYNSQVRALLWAIDCPSTNSSIYEFWNTKIDQKITRFDQLLEAMQTLGNALHLLFSSSEYKFNRNNISKRIFDTIDVKRRKDMLDIVFQDVVVSLGLGAAGKKRQPIGFNQEPVNMLELMEEEDAEEMAQLDDMIQRKIKRKQT